MQRDPRVPKGEPQTWPGASVNPRAEVRTLLRIVLAELPCPSCRRGTLVATGEVREGGNLHRCSTHASDGDACTAQWIVPGAPWPQRREEPDPTSNLLRG
jgi:hypothetical protein